MEPILKILVVDDDATMRRLLSVMLTKLGHDITVCSNGAEAWDFLNQDPQPAVQMIVTDWMMPYLDGPGLIQKVRAADFENYTYIVLLTARDRQTDIVDGLEAGADDYLVKPFDHDEFKARISIGRRILGLETTLKKNLSQMEYLATHDTLTGLLNRRAVFHNTGLAIGDTRSSELLDIGVILFDIDHFKRVNDSFGHLAGDRTLKMVADVTSKSIRLTDYVGRWGGEEFLVVLPSTTPEKTLEVAERIRTEIASTPLITQKHEEIRVEVSVGVAHFATCEGMELDDLLQQADEALYQAKKSGRNRVCIYRPDPINA